MKKIEFGDFQTPKSLSEKVIKLLLEEGVNPKSVIEPTCGIGNFLISSMNHFSEAEHFVGADINEKYIRNLKSRINSYSKATSVKIIRENFFNLDWSEIIQPLNSPILITGNLPWVTNSSMGVIGGENIPEKSNFQNLSGLDAITGKSNFDISEWMYISILKWLKKKQGVIAMLSKTSVARKIIQYAVKNNLNISNSKIFRIDAKKYFNASVDACLFYTEVNLDVKNYECEVYENINTDSPNKIFGIRDGKLIADTSVFEELSYLESEKRVKWRSGIKHDCSKVMELIKINNDTYVNKLSETVELEDRYLYPLLKSSDVAKGRKETKRYVIITQKKIGEETEIIKYYAPKTWNYLNNHKNLLSKRKSSIYKNKPKFSIFGIGDYSFVPYKVSISGLYPSLNFLKIGKQNNKPFMLDDTCYFLPCMNDKEASFYTKILNSTVSKRFYKSYLFEDSKRSITATVLKKLDLYKLALVTNQGQRAKRLLAENNYLGYNFKQFDLQLD